MTKKIAPQDNTSNIKNANRGTSGTNRQYDQNLGNRGKQMALEKAATRGESLKATGSRPVAPDDLHAVFHIEYGSRPTNWHAHPGQYAE